MDHILRRKVEVFVQNNIGGFHEARVENLRSLKLKKLIQNKNPYLFRAKLLNSASDFVAALLDARLSSAEEGSFGNFLERLAVFVAEEACGGMKSPAKGLDIDLTKRNVRYIISVKSGKNWGNSSQHANLKLDFANAVKVLKQNKGAGEIQPTLGICYGNFPTKNNGIYLHIGGQSFWHLLSDDPGLYIDIVEPLGYDAEKHDENFKQEKSNAINRMTREFTIEFCDDSGAIQWPNLVSFVSQNLEPSF